MYNVHILNYRTGWARRPCDNANSMWPTNSVATTDVYHKCYDTHPWWQRTYQGGMLLKLKELIG